MKYILTPEEMKLADQNAIVDYGIPSAILMENAARSSAMIIEKILKENNLKNPKITFFCGSGNNGGDGFALARHLFENYALEIFWVGDEKKMSEETRTNFQIAQKIGIPIVKLETTNDLNSLELKTDCIIDALIGIGGSENIHGIAYEILKKISQVNVLKIALDCPTGLNSSSGFANEFCFKANATITMFAIKTGLVLNDGLNYCGKIYLANLGAPEFIVKNLAQIFSLEEEDIKNLIPRRERISSKFDYGRVLVIAGSERYPGAAALVANATVKSGAGLTILATTTFHPSIFPEVIRFPLPRTDEGSIAFSALDILRVELEKADSIAIGPGLTDNPETLNLVRNIILEYKDKKKIIVDADGLKSLDKDTKLSKNIVITPHTGEFSILTGIERQVIEKNHLYYAKEWANKSNCIVHLKFVPPITTNGTQTYIDLAGNPGLATGGSGDVLTGIIASFLARGLEPLSASSLSAFVHSLAGDKYAEKYGMETLSASSIIDCLKEVL
ncbi:MAG: NAD(P)H-hydrate dehydratase [Ignavibacteria bacterium]|nr:NAD(P)H-hydrate dehydratase [Ignavibacteria bacterium]